MTAEACGPVRPRCGVGVSSYGKVVQIVDDRAEPKMKQLAEEPKVISRWCSKRRPERRLMLSLTFGMICVVAGPALSAEHKYDGVYTGKRSLTKGTASATCPAEDDVSVTITGETLTFTNSAFKKYIMPFHPHSDGSFGETHIEKEGSYVRYHGRIIGDVMDVMSKIAPANTTGI